MSIAPTTYVVPLAHTFKDGGDLLPTLPDRPLIIPVLMSYTTMVPYHIRDRLLGLLYRKLTRSGSRLSGCLAAWRYGSGTLHGALVMVHGRRRIR